MNLTNLLKAGSMLATCVLAGMLAGCQKPGSGLDTPKPEDTLKNQIMLGEEITDIKSVIYSQDNGEWTFWFSPKADLFLIEDVEKTDDYLKAVAKNPKGNVNVATDLVSIEYKGVKVNKDNLGDFAKVEMQAEPILSYGKIMLNFYTLVEQTNGTKMAARFNGKASTGIGAVQENTWQVDAKAPRSILSAVKWSKFQEFTEYYFYAEEGKKEPAAEGETAKFIKVKMTSDIDPSNVDLAKVDKSKFEITCDSMNLLNGAEGTFSVSQKGSTLKMFLDSRFDNNGTPCIFRASSDIKATEGFYSTGKLNFTHGLFNKEIALRTVYHDVSNHTIGGYEIAFGLKENTKELSDLKDPETRYAVHMVISKDQVVSGKIHNLGENPKAITLKVYDYEKYKTYDYLTIAQGTTDFKGKGIVMAKSLGTDGLYINMDVDFGTGMPHIVLDWSGKTSPVQTWVDLTPVRPRMKSFVAKAPAGTDFATSSMYKEITDVKVVKNDNGSVQGCKMATYDFTITCADKSRIIFNYKQSDVNAGEIDITSREDTGYSPNADTFLFKLEFKGIEQWDYWDFWGNWNLVNSGQITNTWCGMNGPMSGTINVSNKGDSWMIFIDFKNAIDQGWGTSGDGHLFKLQFDGNATK